MLLAYYWHKTVIGINQVLCRYLRITLKTYIGQCMRFRYLSRQRAACGYILPSYLPLMASTEWLYLGYSRDQAEEHGHVYSPGIPG